MFLRVKKTIMHKIMGRLAGMQLRDAHMYLQFQLMVQRVLVCMIYI